MISLGSKGSHCYEYPRLAVTVGIAVFAVLGGVLHVLLVRRPHKPFGQCWTLPGGFVEEQECLDSAARRELAEETHLSDVFIEQLYSFGRPDRDPRGRMITIAYYALLSADHAEEIDRTGDAAEVHWFAIGRLKSLAFDHEAIVDCAVERLEGKAQYTTVAFHLLPDEFTFSQLQRVYEAIWQKKLDRRNFRKWINSLHLVIKTGRQRSNGHRPASIYRFNQDKSEGDRLVKLGS